MNRVPESRIDLMATHFAGGNRMILGRLFKRNKKFSRNRDRLANTDERHHTGSFEQLNMLFVIAAAHESTTIDPRYGDPLYPVTPPGDRFNHNRNARIRSFVPHWSAQKDHRIFALA